MRKNLIMFEKHNSESSQLFRNIKLMSKRVILSPLQQKLLALPVLRDKYSELDNCLDNIPAKTEGHLFRLLGNAMAANDADIRNAVARSSSLIKSGLIKIDPAGFNSNMKLEPMDGLCDALLAENKGEDDLLRHFLVPAKKSTLGFKDYSHANKDYEILIKMLRSCIKNDDQGVNILLYGPPGTGKTELARLLSEKLKTTLFEVKTEDEDGDPVSSKSRLEGYRFCQQILSGDRKSLILFDEVEDIFPERGFSFFGMEVKSGDNKGWINKALEENQTPAIWICNKISQIDPAFLRRFDYSMKLDTPPRSVRLNIVRSRLANTPVSESLIQQLAEHEELSPAQVAKAGKVLERMGYKDKKAAEGTLKRILENSTKAMGQKPLAKHQKHVTNYSPDYLNTNLNVTNLVDGLSRSMRGNLCFYGAPGTGKTALAGYIAEQLDKPLICKRASDILSMWVGQAEKNIARMFEQARQEEAVLVLDEADSFLRDRRNATKSWEVTQVNELLVQMENFEGLFICSTNLMDDLDQASLRRFAMKVKFDYLTSDQAWKMLCKESVGKPSASNRSSIDKLDNLAPGDFSAVKKKLDILGEKATPNRLISYLEEECVAKNEHLSNTIGFLQ